MLLRNSLGIFYTIELHITGIACQNNNSVIAHSGRVISPILRNYSIKKETVKRLSLDIPYRYYAIIAIQVRMIVKLPNKGELPYRFLRTHRYRQGS